MKKKPKAEKKEKERKIENGAFKFLFHFKATMCGTNEMLSSSNS